MVKYLSPREFGKMTSASKMSLGYGAKVFWDELPLWEAMQQCLVEKKNAATAEADALSVAMRDGLEEEDGDLAVVQVEFWQSILLQNEWTQAVVFASETNRVLLEWKLTLQWVTRRNAMMTFVVCEEKRAQYAEKMKLVEVVTSGNARSLKEEIAEEKRCLDHMKKHQGWCEARLAVLRA